nr:DUF4352 domain-containing protein [Actinopolymorpha cephalotaxi]
MLSGGDDDATASDQTTTSVDDSADAAVAEDAKKVDKKSTEATKSDDSEKAEKVEKTAGIGDPVRDGDFTFTVTKVTDGPARIGDEYLNTKPQGKFVFVHVTVENHGKEAGTFFGDNQYLVDTQGRKASADSEAAVYLKDAQSLLEEINPGNKLSGVVIFDVPKDATPASLELHDSMLSGGVKVAVK